MLAFFKSIHLRKIYIAILVIAFFNTNAQEKKQSAFGFNYNYQIPIGELANTFGNNSAIGASYFIETTNDIIFGIESNYMFGTDIKDSTIFDNISTSTGAIIGADGHYSNVNLMQRGFDAYLFAGYAFHFSLKEFNYHRRYSNILFIFCSLVSINNSSLG